MYQTHINNPIHLVHHVDGIVHTYKSFDDLVANWLGICRLHIGAKPAIDWDHNEYIRCWLSAKFRNAEYPKTHYDYVLRDSFGDYIDPETVRSAYRVANPYISKWGGYPNARSPGRKRHSYRWYRHPRTTQERRWAHAWDDEEDAPKVRASRNARNLPDAWDDYVRQDADVRNWKRYRRHQWK